FQAEDGIRDFHVTGVQTCALPIFTKICNRKSFDENLHKALTDASAGDSPLCLMLLDIDHFKRFNDTWGHQTGDQVLRLVAMTLRSEERRVGKEGRTRWPR